MSFWAKGTEGMSLLEKICGIFGTQGCGRLADQAKGRESIERDRRIAEAHLQREINGILGRNYSSPKSPPISNDDTKHNPWGYT